MAFLPSDYTTPKPDNQFVVLDQGKHTFRIMSEPERGWLAWSHLNGETKPVRRPEAEGNFTQEELSAMGAERAGRYFWDMIVWEYESESFKALEISQASIIDAIFKLHQDERWGDPRKYDITIKREGEGLNTKYTTIPSPPKELHPKIVADFGNLVYDLKAIYRGEYPFQL